MSRLAIVSGSLASALRRASVDQQRDVSLKACEFAVERSGVCSPIVDQVLQLLRASRRVPSEWIHDLQALTQRLDNEYFDLQQAADEGRTNDDEWKRMFSQARAASALMFASGADAFEAASEAIYEAAATVDPSSEFLASISRSLA